MAFGGLIVLLLSSASSLANGSTSSRISIQQLRSDRSGINLHRLLHDSRGILRIAISGNVDNEDASFSSVRKRALSHLCDCPIFHPLPTSPRSQTHGGQITFEEALQSHPTNLQQITLPDGTVRRTLASATIGFDSQHALELPFWVRDTCGLHTYDAFEDLRGVVADIVESFVERLDQELESSTIGSPGFSGSLRGAKGDNYRHILSSANHLEHFHVYTKPPQSPRGDNKNLAKASGGSIHDYKSSDHSGQLEEASTLDYHKDAGFFLSFVPAMNCHSYTTDSSSFHLKGHQGPVIFEDDEVVILMGAGAQYWLPSPKLGNEDEENPYPFLAASHALRLSQGTHRSWYGKMHLLSSSLTRPWSSFKNGDVLPLFRLKGEDSPVDGCGTTALNEDSLPALFVGTKMKKQVQRRLQHTYSPLDCNNQTNFFCWKQCIDIPEAEQAEQYVMAGYSLYCLDPAELSSSENSIEDATGPCEGGYAHNPNCVGSWQQIDEHIPGYKLLYEVKVTEHGHDNNHEHSSANMPNMGEVMENEDGDDHSSATMFEMGEEVENEHEHDHSSATMPNMEEVMENEDHSSATLSEMGGGMENEHEDGHSLATMPMGEVIESEDGHDHSPANTSEMEEVMENEHEHDHSSATMPEMADLYSFSLSLPL